MNRILAIAALAIVVAMASACSQKGSAQTALEAAEAALAAVYEDSQKYIPNQYAEVKAELDTARGYFNEEQYLRAIDEVKDIPDKARALSEAAATARETLAGAIAVDWTRLEAELPGRLAAVDARLDELGKARRLPAGLSRDALAQIGGQAGVAREAWNEGVAAHEAGDLEGAVAHALESENLAGELMAELGMVPAPAAD